jgi:Domain of unknown function (DUF4145)
MTQSYGVPELDKEAFNCPFCNGYAHFRWGMLFWDDPKGNMTSTVFVGAKCACCQKLCLWDAPRWGNPGSFCIDGELIHPQISPALLVPDDLPEKCRSDYEEARQVVTKSPRAAAALLRLCIQRLCMHFGEKGENVNHDIGELVKKGMDRRIQQALDTVRVIGNNAVHPGEMAIDDNPELVTKLFRLIHVIVDDMITKSNAIESLYGSLPSDKLKGIENRDSGSNE